MMPTDPGILPDSEYYFATPSMLAKSLFYYVLCAGCYSCAPGYHVRRERYNSVLLMYVRDGCCAVKSEGRACIAGKNDLVLLNCYRPHEYYTADTGLKTVWLHFDGSQSIEFAEAIHKTRGLVFPCEQPSLFIDSMTSILNVLRSQQAISEASVSCLIHTMLCNLVSTTTVSGAMEPESGAVSDAMAHIRSHYARNITVESLARLVSMSPSHFSRLFKKHTGYTPYEYLIKIRIDNAKSLLKRTDLPVAEIAFSIGFNSPSSFIYTFRVKTGISPSRFRSMPF